MLNKKHNKQRQILLTFTWGLFSNGIPCTLHNKIKRYMPFVLWKVEIRPCKGKYNRANNAGKIMGYFHYCIPYNHLTAIMYFKYTRLFETLYCYISNKARPLSRTSCMQRVFKSYFFDVTLLDYLLCLQRSFFTHRQVNILAYSFQIISHEKGLRALYIAFVRCK